MRHLLVILFAITAVTSSLYGQEKEKDVTYTVIKNVKVFDGTSEQLKDGPVLIENNLIKAIGPQVNIPDGAIEIDGKGGTVIPGLIDMHAHHVIHEGMLEGRNSYDQMAMGAMTGERLRDYLDQGFTTSRDAGGNISSVAKAVRLDRIPGPRIYSSGGFISQTGGHADTGMVTDQLGDRDILARSGFGHIVDGKAEVIQAVRHNLRGGATQIKVMAGGGVASEFDPIHMSQFTYDEMKAAVDVAEDYGTYVLVHAYHDRAVNRAIDAAGCGPIKGKLPATGEQLLCRALPKHAAIIIERAVLG